MYFVFGDMDDLRFYSLVVTFLCFHNHFPLRNPFGGPIKGIAPYKELICPRDHYGSLEVIIHLQKQG